MAPHADDIFFLGQERLDPDAEAPHVEETPAQEDSDAPAPPGDRGGAGRWRVAMLAAAPLAPIAIAAALQGGGSQERQLAPSTALPRTQAPPVLTAPRAPRPRLTQTLRRRRRPLERRVSAEHLPSKTSSEGTEREPIIDEAPVSSFPEAAAPMPPPPASVPAVPPAPPGPSLPLGGGPGARPEFGIER